MTGIEPWEPAELAVFTPADNLPVPEGPHDLVAAEGRAARWESTAAQARSIHAKAEEMHLRIKEWEQHELAPLIARLEQDEAVLRAFGEQCRAADPSTATFRLPSAWVKAHRGSLELVVTDEKAAVGWAWRSENGTMVRRPEPKFFDPEVDKNALKAELGKTLRSTAPNPDAPGDWEVVDIATGEIVPGVVARRNPLRITVEEAGGT